MRLEITSSFNDIFMPTLFQKYYNRATVVEIIVELKVVRYTLSQYSVHVCTMRAH